MKVLLLLLFSFFILHKCPIQPIPTGIGHSVNTPCFFFQKEEASLLIIDANNNNNTIQKTLLASDDNDPTPMRSRLPCFFILTIWLSIILLFSLFSFVCTACRTSFYYSYECSISWFSKAWCMTAKVRENEAALQPTSFNCIQVQQQSYCHTTTPTADASSSLFCLRPSMHHWQQIMLILDHDVLVFIHLSLFFILSKWLPTYCLSTKTA